jgi:hypothetical protein
MRAWGWRTVERIVALARANERDIASADEARAIIGLGARSPAPAGDPR